MGWPFEGVLDEPLTNNQSLGNSGKRTRYAEATSVGASSVSNAVQVIARARADGLSFVASIPGNASSENKGGTGQVNTMWPPSENPSVV